MATKAFVPQSDPVALPDCQQNWEILRKYSTDQLVKSQAFSTWLNNAAGVTLANGAVVPFSAMEWDTTSGFTTGAAAKFQPTTAGIWRFDFCIQSGALLGADVFWCATLRRNGAAYREGNVCFQRGAAFGANSVGVADVFLNGSTDNIDLIINHNNGAATAINTSLLTFLSGHYLGTK